MKQIYLILLIIFLSVTCKVSNAQSLQLKTYYCRELKGIFKYADTKELAFEKTYFTNATIEFNEKSKLITIIGTDPDGNQNQTIHYHFVEYFINPLTKKTNGEMVMMDNYNNKYFVRIDTSDGSPIIAIFNNPEKVTNGLTYFMIGNLTYTKSW